MRIARVEADGVPVFCLEHADGSLELCTGSPFTHDLNPSGRPAPADARRLAPTAPTKVVVVGRNYLEHIHESNRDVPEEPMISIKPSTTVIGPGEAIRYPASSSRVDPEAELGVVIGRLARTVREDEAADLVLGYTCLNDVTARDLQRKDVQWTRGKGFDTFCPLGPVVVTDLDPRNIELRCYVNDELRQRARTSAMLFPVPKLVAFVSQVMTLLPGDVIATGTPAGIAPMHPGDWVTVEIEGIGQLRNPIVAG